MAKFLLQHDDHNHNRNHEHNDVMLLMFPWKHQNT